MSRDEDEPPPSTPSALPLVFWGLAAVLVIALFVLLIGLLF